jgi:hypothetical protein
MDETLDNTCRKEYFEELNADFARLRADPAAWAEGLAERKLWEATLMEGLDAAELWTEDGTCQNSMLANLPG